MKLCKDCIFYRVSNTTLDDKCYNPESVLEVDPVRGNTTYTTCREMRETGYLCGTEGKLFIPVDKQ